MPDQVSALNSESFLLARLAAAGVAPRRACDAFFRVCGCDGLRGAPPPAAEEDCEPSLSFGLWYKASGGQYAAAVAAAVSAGAGR